MLFLKSEVPLQASAHARVLVGTDACALTVSALALDVPPDRSVQVSNVERAISAGTPIGLLRGCPTVALCLGTYGDPMGVVVSYERGTPVVSNVERAISAGSPVGFLRCCERPRRDGVRGGCRSVRACERLGLKA